jgi:hypothetical protein
MKKIIVLGSFLLASVQAFANTSYFLDSKSGYFALTRETTRTAGTLEVALVGRIQKNKITEASAFLSSDLEGQEVWTRIVKRDSGILGVSEQMQPTYRVAMFEERGRRVLSLTATPFGANRERCPTITLKEKEWGRDWVPLSKMDRDFSKFSKEGSQQVLRFDFDKSTLQGEGIDYSYRELSVGSGLLVIRQPHFDPAAPGAQTLEPLVDSLGATILKEGICWDAYQIIKFPVISSSDPVAGCFSPAETLIGKK